MHHKKITFFADEINSLNTCFGEVFYFSGSAFEKPYETNYINHYKHNLNNCEGCNRVHKDIQSKMELYYQKFPLCCELHTNLLKAAWFNKDDYQKIPKLVADKTVSAYHHFIDKIDNDNWKEDITDYIEYLTHSLGQMPKNYGEPVGRSKFLHFLIDLIQSSDVKVSFENYKPRKDYILKYLNDFFVPFQEKQINLNVLISIYDKWYKTFPFELEFFKPLKAHYAKSIPVLAEKPHYNPYMGLAKAKMKTQEEFIDYIFKLTQSILSLIDTSQMLNDEYITDTSKYNIDLKKKAHSLSQSNLLNKFSFSEERFVNTIVKWLENENKFITSILPDLPKTYPKKNIQSKPTSFFLISAEASDEPIKDFFDTLSKNKFVTVESKSNFIKAFSGKNVKQKIVWSGDFGDLKSLVNYLKSENKIKPTGHNHLQITAQLFTRLNGGDFTNKEINATKTTTNDAVIKQLVATL
jgi:hypothetical protein